MVLDVLELLHKYVKFVPPVTVDSSTAPSDAPTQEVAGVIVAV